MGEPRAAVDSRCFPHYQDFLSLRYRRVSRLDSIRVRVRAIWQRRYEMGTARGVQRNGNRGLDDG